jgi:Na+-driven multidrug efflux pump
MENQASEIQEEESLWQMCLVILKQAGPNTVGFMVNMIQESINLIFLGHLNKPELLAGVGIGNMFMNMTGLSIVFGLNGALETLTS